MLTELSITYPQYLVLMVLWEKDNQPVNDIAHRLVLETNTVTPLLQRMEKLGFATIPSGWDQQLSACPLKKEYYPRLEQEMDAIINTLQN